MHGVATLWSPCAKREEEVVEGEEEAWSKKSQSEGLEAPIWPMLYLFSYIHWKKKLRIR